MIKYPSPGPTFSYEFSVPPETLDQNGHVNNVTYVQWMQDAAVRHFTSLGGIPIMQAVEATWVVRSHKIEYFNPAFTGDRLQVQTWIASLRRVRSLRRYRFFRLSDGKLLVKGETDWVFVDARSGKPRAIPEQVSGIFPLLPDDRSA
jgi:acyl-CoA thioester hydrolase